MNFVPERLDVVTYSQAHLRLKVDRGRAADYPCLTCAKPAREWAYLGGDPLELTDPKSGCVYSLDQSRYAAMCRNCHKRRDRALADGRSVDVCPRGHRWAENEIVRPVRQVRSGGARYCRTCHREETIRYAEAQRARNAEKMLSRGAIRAELWKRRLSLKWLSMESGIAEHTLRRRLAHPENFTVAELRAIGDALDIAPTDLFAEAVSA